MTYAGSISILRRGTTFDLLAAVMRDVHRRIVLEAGILAVSMVMALGGGSRAGVCKVEGMCMFSSVSCSRDGVGGEVCGVDCVWLFRGISSSSSSLTLSVAVVHTIDRLVILCNNVEKERPDRTHCRESTLICWRCWCCLAAVSAFGSIEAGRQKGRDSKESFVPKNFSFVLDQLLPWKDV